MNAIPPVRDNPQEQRFEIEIDGAFAVANYEIDGDVITFTHTAVPSSLQHRGLGTRLVEAALETARSRGLTVVPVCSMFVEYLRAHPEAAGPGAGAGDR